MSSDGEIVTCYLKKMPVLFVLMAIAAVKNCECQSPSLIGLNSTIRLTTCQITSTVWPGFKKLSSEMVCGCLVVSKVLRGLIDYCTGFIYYIQILGKKTTLPHGGDTDSFHLSLNYIALCIAAITITTVSTVASAMDLFYGILRALSTATLMWA
jgi:hypothetical protein